MRGKLGHLGGLIRDARKKAKLTQADLAKRAGIGISAVRAIEKSHGRISTMDAILKCLGLELRGRQLIAGPLGPALAFARKRRNTSRRELARSLGVSRNTLAGIEAGVGLASILEGYAVAVGAGLYIAKIDEPRTFFNHAGNSSGFNGWQTPGRSGSGALECSGRVSYRSMCCNNRPPQSASESKNPVN